MNLNVFKSHFIFFMNPIFSKRFIVILNGLFSSLIAQDYVDLLATGVMHSPANKQKTLTEKVDMTETFTNVRLPLVLKNKDIVILGANFTSLSFHGNYEPIHSNIFYTSTLQLGYTKKWNDKFQSMLLALPKISSDFKDISSQDFQMGGVLLFTVTKRESLKYKFGAYYNHEYFGPLILPILGIDWQPNEKWSLFGNLPINLTLNRKLSPRFSTGLFFQAINMSYRLGENYQNQYLQKYSQELSLYLDTYLTKNIVFTIKAGHTLGRTLEFYHKGEKHKARSMFVSIGERGLPLNDEIKDGAILELRLSYRVSIKKAKEKENTTE